MHTLDDVVKHFGGISALARALGINRQSVYHWKEHYNSAIPELRCYQIQALTDGKFSIDTLPIWKTTDAA